MHHPPRPALRAALQLFRASLETGTEPDAPDLLSIPKLSAQLRDAGIELKQKRGELQVAWGTALDARAKMDAMTGVMNAMGQDGDYAASRLPIKNRVNALDVSHFFKKTNCRIFNLYREAQKMLSSYSMITKKKCNF